MNLAARYRNASETYTTIIPQITPDNMKLLYPEHDNKTYHHYSADYVEIFDDDDDDDNEQPANHLDKPT